MLFPADPYRRAQLGATDLSNLMRVSRLTATRWLAGKPVHAMARAQVHTMTARVQRALEAGHLPTEPARGPARAKALAALLAGK